MASTNKAYVSEKSGNVITPRGRLAWPALFEPTKMRDQPDDHLKYQCTLLIPADADIAAMKKAAEDAAVKKFGSKPPKSLRSPFRETSENERLEEYADEYPFYITARSKERPATVRADNARCDDPEEVYSGRWAKMSCQAFGYDTAGNKGVSFGLQNVQLLEDDEELSVGGARAKPESDFEPAEVEDAESLFA